MKSQQLPPYSFLLLFLLLGLTFTAPLWAQEATDSTDYYGKILLNPNKDADVASAFDYLDRNLKNDLKKRDTLQAVKKLRYIVIGQIELGALFEGEETATRALRLLDGLPLNPEVRNAKKGLYNDLGMIYRILKNPINSLRFYDETLKYCENNMDSMVVMNNKGNTYMDMGNFSLAEKQFQKVYEISVHNSDTVHNARTLNNLGFAQSKMGDGTGLENMLTALEIRIQGKDPIGLYSSYSNLAQYHHQNSNQKEALDYAEKAYQIAHRINSPSYIKNSLENLLKIREDTLSREFIKLNDSIEVAKLQKQNKYAGMQYNLLKEKKKTEKNKLLQEREKRNKQGYQFLGALLLLTTLAIYFIQASRNKKNTIKQIYNTESRISKKIHDEVANEVYQLMTKIQVSQPESDSLLDDLEGLYTKTRDISRENTSLFIQDDFGTQVKELLESYQQEDTVVTTQNISQVQWKDLSEIKKINLYRVLQEMMTNMKKHSKASQVLVSFQKNGKKLQVKYVDNGVGCHLKNKNGLQNMETRINAVGGIINFETSPHKGFKIILII